MIRQIVFLFVKRWHISLVLQCSRSHYDYDSSSFSLSRLPIDNSPSTATTSSASLFELSTTACFMGSVADDPSATSSGIALPTSSSSDAVQRSSRSTATTTQLDTNRTNYNTPTVLQRHGFVRRLRWLKLGTSSLNEATVCIFIVSNWYDISTFVECVWMIWLVMWWSRLPMEIVAPSFSSCSPTPFIVLPFCFAAYPFHSSIQLCPSLPCLQIQCDHKYITSYRAITSYRGQ